MKKPVYHIRSLNNWTIAQALRKGVTGPDSCGVEGGRRERETGAQRLDMRPLRLTKVGTKGRWGGRGDRGNETLVH